MGPLLNHQASHKLHPAAQHTLREVVETPVPARIGKKGKPYQRQDHHKADERPLQISDGWAAWRYEGKERGCREGCKQGIADQADEQTCHMLFLISRLHPPRPHQARSARLTARDGDERAVQRVPRLARDEPEEGGRNVSEVQQEAGDVSGQVHKPAPIEQWDPPRMGAERGRPGPRGHRG